MHITGTEEIKTAVRENIFSSLGVRQAGESFRLSQLNELAPTLIFSLADPRRDLTEGDCSLEQITRAVPAASSVPNNSLQQGGCFTGPLQLDDGNLMSVCWA